MSRRCARDQYERTGPFTELLAGGGGEARFAQLALNLDPNQLNKYLYIERTPTWVVRALYGFGLASWLLVVYGYSFVPPDDPFYRYVAGPILLFLTLYYVSSFSLCLFYKQPNLRQHKSKVEAFWRHAAEAPVDVFLPVCGENREILRNTWKHVSRLNYDNVKVYVLDDSPSDADLNRRLAAFYGFTYLSRPNKGEIKKAGNLKYGYEHSTGEFVTVFDADFAPHRDFLKELIPYMAEKRVAIVQSPQYFETRNSSSRLTAWEYAGARGQEIFYRFIQVVRDRFNGAVCCGSNAIYRRLALADIGGTVQVEYGEDTRTGVALMCAGWRIRYVPIILAVGLSPNNPHSFFHQQHRWCMSSMHQVLGLDFWFSPLSWRQKWCYATGYLFYLSQPLSILFTFHLFWTLFVYNDYISLSGSLLFYPYLLFSYFLLQAVIIQRFRWSAFFGFLLLAYSCSHGVITAMLRKTGTWIPTNSKQGDISRSFHQVTKAVGVYVFSFIILIALGVRSGTLDVSDHNFFPVQFWILYDLLLSGSLLWFLYRTIDGIRRMQLSGVGLALWRMKTAGIYLVLVVGSFATILFV